MIMAMGEMTKWLIRRVVDGFSKSEYANPEWIGEPRFDNNTMWSFWHHKEIIESTRLEF